MKLTSFLVGCGIALLACTPSGNAGTFGARAPARLAAAGGSGGSGSNSDIYAGLSCTKYAASSSQGSGNGSSEANATALSTALSAGAAGDVICVIPGTYTGSTTGDRFVPSWKISASGTSGSPIKVVAKYAAAIYGSNLSEMRSGTTTDGAGNPAFGVNGYDYQEWIGFYVDEANSATHADTGPAVLTGTTGSKIMLAHIAGKTTYTPGDNHNGIRIEGTYGVTVSDNKVHGFYCSVVNPINGAGIETYKNGNLTIRNNTVYDSGAGIQLKADGDDAASSGDTPDAYKGWFLVTQNYVHDVLKAGIVAGRSYSGYDRQITQNILHVVNNVDDGAPLTTWSYAPDQPRRLKIQNNTLYGSGSSVSGVFLNGQLEASNQFYNNIVVGVYRGVYSEGMTSFTTSLWEAEHNCYYGYGTFGTLMASNISLASYQSTYSMDSVSPSAVSSDPLFTNVGTLDFHLQAGSPCRNVGRDLLNLSGLGAGATINAGAYITGSETIGVRS